MRFFIDTADIDEIRDLAATGLVDGVTTNPSLVAKSGGDFFAVLREICAIVPGPVSAEVTATDTAAMIEEAHRLAQVAENIVVKVPLTPDGLKACRVLTDAGTKVNVTLCFSAAQAILAAKAGARYVSPFIGRLDDIGADGLALIGEIVEIYGAYPEFTTEVPYTEGVVGAARTADPDSAGSQWFVTLDEASSLNGQYTVFAEVTDGIDVVKCITPRDPSTNPGAPPGDKIISIDITEA